MTAFTAEKRESQRSFEVRGRSPRRWRVIGAALAVMLISGVALAQDSAEDKATRGKARAADLAAPSLKNEPGAKGMAPPTKGGSGAKGTFCDLHVDNRTDLIIQIFVDGSFAGVVGPWGDIAGVFASGTRRLDGVAEFVDGSFSTWGPKSVRCDGRFTWTLTD